MQHRKKELRNFALIWCGIFLIISIAPLLQGKSIREWAIPFAIFFLIIAFTKPAILQPFYTIWTKIGDIIGSIVSKIMLTVLFYAVFTPVAVILRLIGKDPLNKKLDKNADSYWHERNSYAASMEHQF